MATTATTIMIVIATYITLLLICLAALKNSISDFLSGLFRVRILFHFSKAIFNILKINSLKQIPIKVFIIRKRKRKTQSIFNIQFSSYEKSSKSHISGLGCKKVWRWLWLFRDYNRVYNPMDTPWLFRIKLIIISYEIGPFHTF